MCGVIGYSGPSNKDLISALFRENNIRGQHATGISWESGGKIRTFIHPGPASDFLRAVPPEALESERIIGHSRYSTSSLDYNQPISDGSVAVVHNGVISQSSPSMWKEEFGFSCRTENDSELILHAWNERVHPLLKFSEASIASCLLNTESLTFFRNGKRPLWYWAGKDSVVVVSARNILSRVIRESSPFKCKPYVEYRCVGSMVVESQIERPDFREDLQYGVL